jgi:CDP-diacylglycerol---serine O-phosphatidyltransferase
MKKLDAKEITSKARTHAHNVRVKAQEQVDVMRTRTKEGVQKVTDQAKETAQEAARMFRINLANTLTLFNAVCGFLSMLLAMQQHYFTAASFILAGVVFDYLDGKAARAFGEESPLGKELDSLSDLVTFGVAPAVLVAQIAPSLLSYGAGALFVLSAALRLGRFNVQQMKGVFFGVPTTTNGILLPLLVLISAPVIIYPWYLLVMAFLMNAPIRIKKIF